VGGATCDLHGESASFNGHYAKSAGTPAVGKYGGGETFASLDVTSAAAASVAFSIHVTGATGHTGEVSGQAAKTTDASVFTFSAGSGASKCALKLHFGATAVVVEEAGCLQQSNGMTFARAYAKP
jgi:hypothetical protein